MGSSAFITKRTKTPAIKNPKDAGPNPLDSQFSAQPLAGQPDAISTPIDTPPSTPTPPPSVGSSSVGTKPTGVGAMSASSASRGVLQIPENNMAPNVSSDPGLYVPDPTWKPGDPKPARPPQPAVNQPLSSAVNATGSTEVAGLPGKKKYGLLRSRFLSSSGLFRTLTNGPQGVSGGADGLLTPMASGDSKPTLG